MANSVDPDQMLHNVTFDLGLHCLQRLSVPIFTFITVRMIDFWPFFYKEDNFVTSC